MSDSEHPYSLVYEKNGIVYVSGAASIDYSTLRAIPGRREALDATLDEVEKRLRSVGLELANIVKATYYLVDISMRKEANQQFEERFQPPRPARTVIGIAAMPYGATVGIDVTAHR